MRSRVRKLLALFSIGLFVVLSFLPIQSANALGLNVKITSEEVEVDVDVIVDYSDHTMVKLLVRFVVWLLEWYFSQLNISVTAEDILEERLIAAIKLQDSDLSVNEVSVNLFPDYDSTVLRVSFVLDGCVEFISRSFSGSPHDFRINETYGVDLGWKAFYSPVELSSDYGEAFKDFLLDLSFSYFVGLICNGTLNAFYNLMKEYSVDLLKQIVNDLTGSDVVDFVRERIVRPFLAFIREHGMGVLIDVIDKFAEKFYDFVLGLKKSPIGWLIDKIISGSIVAIVKLNDFIDLVISWAGSLGFGDFIDEYGDDMFFAGFLLSLIGLHYDILSEHLKYLGNVIVDVVGFTEKVNYLLDHSEELEKVYAVVNSSDMLVKLVGDFFGSMLLNITGFSKPLEEWEIVCEENYTYFYFVVPVYVVEVFGETLVIDPEVKIFLPENSYVVDVEGDVLTFLVVRDDNGDDQSGGFLVYVGSSRNNRLLNWLIVFTFVVLLLKLLNSKKPKRIYKFKKGICTL